jgi:hypothetical protein
VTSKNTGRVILACSEARRLPRKAQLLQLSFSRGSGTRHVRLFRSAGGLSFLHCEYGCLRANGARGVDVSSWGLKVGESEVARRPV